jgi:hypothetical protein
MNANTNAVQVAKRPTIEATINMPEDGGAPMLALTFIDGRSLILDTANLTDAIKQHAMMHGLKQKLVDAAAISRDPETGRAATVDTKFKAVEEVYERVLAGEWNKRREGGAGGSGGLLFRALCRKYADRKTPEQLREWLDGKSDAQQAAMRKDPEIARIIEEIRTEKGDDGAARELFAELDAELGEE